MVVSTVSSVASTSGHYSNIPNPLRKWITELFADSQRDFSMEQAPSMMEHLGNWAECLRASGPNDIAGKYCIAEIILKNLPIDEYDLDRHRTIKGCECEDCSAWSMLRKCSDDPLRAERRKIQWAICLPSSCSSGDLKTSLESVMTPIFDGSGLTVQVNIDSSMCSTSVLEPENYPKEYYITRTIPIYGMVILFVANMLPYLGDGPFWNSSQAWITKPCKRYWLTSLLAVNNFDGVNRLYMWSIADIVIALPASFFYYLIVDGPFSNLIKLLKTEMLKTVYVSCLNFRLVVSIFGWMSHFSSSCLSFRLIVSIFDLMSHFSSRCLKFRLVVSFFVQLSQFSSTVSSVASTSGHYSNIPNPLRKWITELFADLQRDFSMEQAPSMMEHLGNWAECLRASGPNDIAGKYCIAEIMLKNLPIDEYDLDRHLTIKGCECEDCSAWSMLRKCSDDPLRAERRKIQWAICLPSSCLSEDLKTSLESVMTPIFYGSGLTVQVNIDSSMCSTSVLETENYPKEYYITRTIPLYGMVILFVANMLPYLGDGPLWNSSQGWITQPCKRYWLTSLLAVNNFDGADKLYMWSIADIVIGLPASFFYYLIVDGPFSNLIKLLKTEMLKTVYVRKWFKELFSEAEQNFRMDHAAVNSKCRSDFLLYMSHLRNQSVWSVRMRESSEWPSVGVYSGMVDHLGNFAECLRAAGPEGITGKFCMARMQIKNFPISPHDPAICLSTEGYECEQCSAWSILRKCTGDPVRAERRLIQWAICLPSSCTAEDLQISLNNLMVPIFESSDMEDYHTGGMFLLSQLNAVDVFLLVSGFLLYRFSVDPMRGLGFPYVGIYLVFRIMKQSEATRGNPRQPEAIRGNLRQPEAIRGNPRQSEATRGNPRQPEAIRGNPRQSEATRGNPRQSEATRGNPRQSEATRGNPRQPEAIRGNPRQSEATQGNPRQPKAIQGTPRHWCKFQPCTGLVSFQSYV
ncbi:hypothetical protein V9T40_006235 [Parthenolecanium corni]|uniref:Nose resistant-to-fluoxetine protein N-terminal domain-containing protein n=1 Tax=Parthenolecanium corni TaxID=536013 RepID=A0AAN9TTK2_9HEMI